MVNSSGTNMAEKKIDKDGANAIDLLQDLIARARKAGADAAAAEDAALAVKGITNSEGAEAGWGRSRVALAASNGFAGSYAGSSHSVSVAVLSGEGARMERDYDFASAAFAADLRDSAEIGR